MVLKLGQTDLEVDHINGDSLDNRKSNLRLCTHLENMRNRKLHKNNTTGIRGVHWDKTKDKYRAYIRVASKAIHLGYYINPLEADLVYKQARVHYFGAFA